MMHKLPRGLSYYKDKVFNGEHKCVNACGIKEHIGIKPQTPEILDILKK